MNIRLHKWMSSNGIASRRRSGKMIEEGRVSVNGIVVTEKISSIDSELDFVHVDGKLVQKLSLRRYYMLNKPVGYITSMGDPFGRRTVKELVDLPGHIFPIGRLDKDSQGLLLFTDDGDLSHRLLSPEHHCEKEYEVFVTGHVSERSLKKLREGLDIKDWTTRPARVETIESGDGWQTLRIIIHEGKKRQVRRMFAACGHKVLRLFRKRIGPIEIGKLEEGSYRPLSDEELKLLGVQS